MQALEIQINKLPIQLTCYNNGCVSFERLANFHTIMDQPEQGVQAIISNEDIFIGADTEVVYGQMYEYKQMPEMLAWLQAHKMPRFN